MAEIVKSFHWTANVISFIPSVFSPPFFSVLWGGGFLSFVIFAIHQPVGGH